MVLYRHQSTLRVFKEDMRRQLDDKVKELQHVLHAFVNLQLSFLIPRASPADTQSSSRSRSDTRELQRFRPAPNIGLDKLKMASSIWKEYKRFLEYLESIQVIDQEFKEIKLEEAKILSSAHGKQMREHKLVIQESQVEQMQTPSMLRKEATEKVLRALNREHAGTNGWSANRLREH
ncbi:hypothetical protein BGZ65_004646 [Modicella reniformis]|uniref:Uncharacterized protein n=1 Tax=Modicella reniformis TaxID=1440133 RepID=A0A9P6MH59_9FUNG|nr:hypothetical protein BGZ65_004646 [Modicella reniformis]